MDGLHKRDNVVICQPSVAGNNTGKDILVCLIVKPKHEKTKTIEKISRHKNKTKIADDSKTRHESSNYIHKQKLMTW